MPDIITWVIVETLTWPVEPYTWLCDVSLGGCGIREVWRWAPGTVLCRVCAKRIAKLPTRYPLDFTPNLEGMQRGRLTGPINDERTDAERMEAFRRWQKQVNREPIKWP
jgi:hypothetical protein